MNKPDRKFASNCANDSTAKRSNTDMFPNDRDWAVKLKSGPGQRNVDHAALQFGAIGAGDQGRTNRVLAGRGALILELIFLVIEQPNEPVSQFVLLVLGVWNSTANPPSVARMTSPETRPRSSK